MCGQALNACPRNILCRRAVQCEMWQSASISPHQSGLHVVTTLRKWSQHCINANWHLFSLCKTRRLVTLADMTVILACKLQNSVTKTAHPQSGQPHTHTHKCNCHCNSWAMHCRYRQKRHERNFTKRIKYMCRKTLADTRPRVRGRFARNNDAGAVMPHETKKALAAKAKAGKAAAAAQGQQMPGASSSACMLCFFNLLPSHLAATCTLNCCLSA